MYGHELLSAASARPAARDTLEQRAIAGPNAAGVAVDVDLAETPRPRA
jgi:hypothetical protein